MPTAYVKKIASEKHISVEEAEGIWEKAKDAVGKKNGEYPWGVVMSVFKKMVDERTSKYRKK